MNPQIPICISIAFLIAICIPVYLIARLARRYAQPDQSRALFYSILGFYGIYLIGVAIACINGSFSAITLPPKIIQLTTLPLLIFLMVIVFNLKFYKGLLKAIPIHQLILLHRFRFIGSFFLILLLLQLLPTLFALIAGLGDIITAASSFWIARNIESGKKSAHRWAILWNGFGLLDILVTSATAILLTKISMETGALGVDVLATFPFCFIPAFAPATIIFLHISIYRKLFTTKYQ